MWNQRYSIEEYAYGTEPNDYLVAMSDQLPKGKVLCLAEGEGRNAVWLAEQGHDVTAVDFSEVGLRKAKKLAKLRGVNIKTIHANLEDFDIGNQHWDAIVSIFAHMPSAMRMDLHKRCTTGLKIGGVFLLEAYTPFQLEYKTGGPATIDMMMDVSSLTAELVGLDFFHLQERIREVNEGLFHNGTGAVVQVLARKSRLIIRQ
jgi:SAM-dependent methyltransferase